MSESLAVKYRPQKFEEVCSQKSVITILQRQIETKQFKNCYLFAGSSGVGKTTLARIFANEINRYIGTPIEIDAASNNGVDSIREIVANANERALDAEYKIFIIDECHTLTNQSWQSFLKCIEEPPKYTIFMFCTTDPQKIPATILNRVQRFNLTKIPMDEIKSRLTYVCKQEGFTNYNEAIDYIAKLASGCMREALSLLDKARDYSNNLGIENVINALGTFSYDDLFSLTNNLIDGNIANTLTIIENTYNKGTDLKLFIEQYTEFVLDLFKYCLFNDLSVTKFPSLLEDSVKYATGIENNVNFYSRFLDKIFEIKNAIKYDTNIKTTVEILMMDICRGV